MNGRTGRSAKDYAERSSDPRRQERRNAISRGKQNSRKAREHDGMVHNTVYCTPISQSRTIHYRGPPVQYTPIDKCAKNGRMEVANMGYLNTVEALITIQAQTLLQE
jgi:hypothetical protein